MNVSKTKIQALADHNVTAMYDAYTDTYILERRIPASVQQMRVTSGRFEDDHIDALAYAFTKSMRYDDSYTHPGPTTKELRDPRIRNAWEELQILRKLIGANYER